MSVGLVDAASATLYAQTQVSRYPQQSARPIMLELASRLHCVLNALNSAELEDDYETLIVKCQKGRTVTLALTRTNIYSLVFRRF
jgi:hypothetical protein